MELLFTQQELSFISKQFKYDRLVGFMETDFDKKAVIESLLSKGYLSQYEKAYELSNDVRILLSAWTNMRYTVVREDFIKESHVFSIFANSEYILTFSVHEREIRLTMGNFSAESMDKTLLDYLGLQSENSDSAGYNIFLSAEMFLKYFGPESISESLASKELGLPINDVSKVRSFLALEDKTSVIIQDVLDDIGCLAIFGEVDGSVIMMKHIVPNNAIDKQRVVLVKGSANKIVDSIYNI